MSGCVELPQPSLFSFAQTPFAFGEKDSDDRRSDGRRFIIEASLTSRSIQSSIQFAPFIQTFVTGYAEMLFRISVALSDA